MQTWKKILIPFVITVVVGGLYLLFVFHQRSQPGVVKNQAQQQQLSADDLAVVRQDFPQHFEDIQDLAGKSVWMKSGYSMPYYPYAGGRVEWTKPAGLIPPAQKMDVQKAIKAAAPASVKDNIAHDGKQVLVVFTLPGDKRTYATPVGLIVNANEEHYFSDMLFYYDDPHTIYTNWPKDVWAAIDAHQVKPGFSELQTRMSIGAKAQYDDGTKEGDRTADYDVNGKHITVTYAHDKAMSIQGQ